jgi:photosystem II stability/assembly factor-like uncharacterized protein
MKKIIISFFLLLATILVVWGQVPSTLTEKTSWRINQEGRLQRMSNLGSNWETVEVPTSEKLTAFHFLSVDCGWAVGHNATILRWDGERWSEVLVFTNETLLSVFLIDSHKGWAVGNQGTILHWDGISWNPEASPILEGLISVKLASTGIVQITGESGVILVREGEFWQIQSSISEPQLTASTKRAE